MSSAFRVTQKTIAQSTLGNLQGNLRKMQRLQEQLSSGKQINRPSDSPGGTVSALRFRADIRRIEQQVRNAQDGKDWLGTADTALTGSLDIMRRARDLTLQGINATSGTSERAAIAAEIDGLRENLLAVANTRYLDRPVFAGVADTANAFNLDGSYAGDQGAVQRTVADGVTVQVNLPGDKVFGFDPVTPGGAASVFQALENLAANLRSGNIASVGNEDLVALDAAYLAIQNSLALIGARYNQVDTMQMRAEGTAVTLANSLAEVESIDLPKTIVGLQMQEVAYEAALSATARVLQPSLLDFLR
jgi:flagellar hook-associated protein 3 FlgL